MTTEEPADAPLVRRAADVEYDPVDAADGLAKGVLVGPEEGGGNLAIRRFTLAPGGEVPEHTNAVEHEQYVLAGEYRVGIGDETFTVRAGDAIHVPAGAVHWYRNDSDEEGAFLCAVPAGDDEIRLVED
jgi:quercetin dioxygenase-like cupin family protein